jgi:hypothetical protein
MKTAQCEHRSALLAGRPQVIEDGQRCDPGLLQRLESAEVEHGGSRTGIDHVLR